MMRFLSLLLLLSSFAFALYSMHPQTYEVLESSNKLIEKKAFNEAEELLKEALKDTSNKRVYDLAFLEQSLAFLAIQRANYPLALMHYEKALSYESLTKASLSSIYLIVAQLYLQENNTLKSVNYLKRYIKIEKVSSTVATLFMSNALVDKDYALAYTWCNKALSLQIKPSLDLLQTKKSLAIHLDHWEDALQTLSLIMSNFTLKKEHFKELVYLYKRLNNEPKLLASLVLSYENGYLKTNEEHIQLALLYYLAKAPFKGVEVLDTLLVKTPKNTKVLEIQAQLCMAARELVKAVGIYETLLTLKPEHKTAISLARLYSHLEQWSKAQITLKPFIKDNEALLLYAISLAQQKQYKKAKKYFLELKKDKIRVKEALSWLKLLKDK